MEKREGSAGQLLDTIREYEERNREVTFMDRAKNVALFAFVVVVILVMAYVAGN